MRRFLKLETWEHVEPKQKMSSICHRQKHRTWVYTRIQHGHPSVHPSVHWRPTSRYAEAPTVTAWSDHWPLGSVKEVENDGFLFSRQQFVDFFKKLRRFLKSKFEPKRQHTIKSIIIIIIIIIDRGKVSEAPGAQHLGLINLDVRDVRYLGPEVD